MRDRRVVLFFLQEREKGLRSLVFSVVILCLGRFHAPAFIPLPLLLLIEREIQKMTDDEKNGWVAVIFDTTLA